MNAFIYGVFLQWKLDLRSKTLLIACYLVPLSFFAIMGGIFTSVMPESRHTLIQSMTVFGVTMGAFIGLPPSLVEIYGSAVKKVYQANGVPLWLGLALTNLSAFLHLLTMSVLLYLAAPVFFHAALPENPGLFFAGTALFAAVSLGAASVIGMAVKDQAKASMFSILVFLPSIMLSGIMFPAELLPKLLRTAGNLFPAAWGYRLLTARTFRRAELLPLLLIFLFTVLLCAGLLRRLRRR